MKVTGTQLKSIVKMGGKVSGVQKQKPERSASVQIELLGETAVDAINNNVEALNNNIVILQRVSESSAQSIEMVAGHAGKILERDSNADLMLEKLIGSLSVLAAEVIAIGKDTKALLAAVGDVTKAINKQRKTEYTISRDSDGNFDKIVAEDLN